MPSPTLKRRSLLLGFAGLAAGTASARDLDPWAHWKAAFLGDDGRVIDTQNDGISHSEGQAYGMLLAQAFGDCAAFARIEAWTNATLATRQDALMAWKWENGAVRDWRNATDGDLLRAWALLRASRDSGWSGYSDRMQRICEDLVDICLAPDPRAPDQPVLKPADQSMATRASVLVNPSYYMIRAMIELGEASGQTALVRAAAHGERLLANPAALRDWISITQDGIEPARGFSDTFGWDALRIPLYLVWSGRMTHPALARVRAKFAAATAPGHVATVTGPEGQMHQQSNAAGFRAIAAISAGHPPENMQLPANDYYSATLGMLAQIAWREGT